MRGQREALGLRARRAQARGGAGAQRGQARRERVREQQHYGAQRHEPKGWRWNKSNSIK